MKVVVRPRKITPQPLPPPDRRQDVVLFQRGKHNRSDFHVFIESATLSVLMEYAYADLYYERGGVVVGHYGTFDDQNYIDIDGFIPATRAISHRAALTFTHEAWDEVHRIMEQEFIGRIILGWMHTHPGYGLFLSGHDQFIDNNFFAQPFRIAIVVDPTFSPFDAVGVFIWDSNDAQRRVRSGFTVYCAVEV